MPSTERKRARWRGLTTRPSSDRSPGLENNNSYLNHVDQKSIKEAAERSRHLVQEQWVHEDWESGEAIIFYFVPFEKPHKCCIKPLKKNDTRRIYKNCFSQDGRNAEKDGGSSFVVSPQQQLYRLHVSSISDACLSFFVNDLMSFPR